MGEGGYRDGGGWGGMEGGRRGRGGTSMYQPSSRHYFDELAQHTDEYLCW